MVTDATEGRNRDGQCQAVVLSRDGESAPGPGDSRSLRGGQIENLEEQKEHVTGAE